MRKQHTVCGGHTPEYLQDSVHLSKFAEQHPKTKLSLEKEY